MPSRQDQLHSYQFSVQRVVAALVMRDTDPAQSPFRKVAGPTMAGALFAALGMAGAVVFALLGGSGSDWKADGQVIIEKESGARYVYYKPDGKLHPAINYASALLIADGAKPKATTFSRKSLNAAPRGAPMGIAGAPDSIPESGQLLKKPWTVCSGPGDTAGTGKPQSVVLVGQSVTAGDVLPATIERAPGVLLVSTRDDQAYLIYQNIRHRIVDPPTVLAAFAISSQNVVRVAPAFVNAVPAGPDIGPMQISGLHLQPDRRCQAVRGGAGGRRCRDLGGTGRAVDRRQGHAGPTEGRRQRSVQLGQGFRDHHAQAAAVRQHPEGGR